MELPRLSGSGGLAPAVSAALESGLASRTLLVFDFDRTLTNGISRPGDEAETAKVVRGGEATVAALRLAHEAGAGLFIITARRPARLSVEQLFASMDNAQSALSPFFPRGDCVEFRFGSEQGGVPLARGGSVYASGYQKAAALAHIVSDQKQAGLRVFFFDDSVVNSCVVGTSAAQHMAGGELAPAVAELTSYWWDSYEEKMGPSPTMGLSPFGTADSNYSDHLRHMLLAYGVTAAERDARIAAYRAAGNLRHGLQRCPKARGVGAELASVEAASKASRAKMSGLAERLSARFARGPRPPPAPGAARAPAKGAGGGLGALLGARRPPPPQSAGPASSAGVAGGVAGQGRGAKGAGCGGRRSLRRVERRLAPAGAALGAAVGDGVPSRAAGRGHHGRARLYRDARRGLRRQGCRRRRRGVRRHSVPAGSRRPRPRCARRVPRRRGTRLHPRGGRSGCEAVLAPRRL